MLRKNPKASLCFLIRLSNPAHTEGVKKVMRQKTTRNYHDFRIVFYDCFFHPLLNQLPRPRSPLMHYTVAIEVV